MVATRQVLVSIFHEIALKGLNQPMFIRQARRNLETALQGIPVRKANRGPMTVLLTLEDETHWPLLQERLSLVLGVDKFARAHRVAPDLAGIKEALAHLLEGRNAASFRITAKRSDKSFPLTSPELNKELGTFVQGITGTPVSLKTPDLNIHVQVLSREALIFFQELPGPGGLPVGIGGRVACLLSGGIDSPVAAWRMMKRGCPVVFVHFHSFPLVEGTSREKARELVQRLTCYQYQSLLYLVPFSEVQKRILLAAPPSYRVVLYRRFMVRIAEALALRQRAGALVTGESLGQVSSQTLENITVIGAAAQRLPILRPLIGMDKEEIVAQARHLGTYPISIIPDQDCCSLFVPKHPVTRSRLEEVEQMESQLDVAGMVEEAAAAAEEVRYRWPTTE